MSPVKTKEIEKHNKERLQAVSGFLKWYRINSGYSQQELSECSGVHRNTIIRLESGNPVNQNLMTVYKIADAMEIDVNQIFLEII